ncbi:hypothetical protein C9374_013559 [Naegleria lovaniensis]|uniref:Uncharacterized protein n=1 Tax=Naegleria lovaniensis TaxID=51637 RepID=A0AA88H1Q2_NAELO|nr:uncharacterized protein C9374_013559 [Naegleria lovaniensis]KAG2392074.1 hypothetical protein C9374_013559 [Naegleria lovaniensis]
MTNRNHRFEEGEHQHHHHHHQQQHDENFHDIELQEEGRTISSPTTALKSSLKQNSKYGNMTRNEDNPSSTSTPFKQQQLSDVANHEDLDELENNSAKSNSSKPIDWNKLGNRVIYLLLGIIMASLLMGFSLYFIITEIVFTKALVPKPDNFQCSELSDKSLEAYLNASPGNVYWNSSFLLNSPGDYVYTRYETSSVTYLNYFSYVRESICNLYPAIDPYCKTNSPEILKFHLYYAHGSTRNHFALQFGDKTSHLGFIKSHKFVVYDCLDNEIGSIKEIQDTTVSTSADYSNKDFVIFSANETQVLALIIDRIVYLPRRTSDEHTYVEYVYKSPRHGTIYPGQKVAFIERHKIGTTDKRYWYTMKIFKRVENPILFILYHYMVPYYYTLSTQS